MKGFLIGLYLAPAIFFCGSVCHGAAFGVLYAGPETNVSFGVQKLDGDLFFLMDMNNNPNRVEYMFSPGNLFNQATVVLVNGEPLMFITLMDGTQYGRVNSEGVTFQEGTEVDRTSQKTRFNYAIAAFAEQNKENLRDAKGNLYSYADLKGIVFLFQVPAGTNTVPDAREIHFDTLKNGEIKQILGETPLQALRPQTINPDKIVNDTNKTRSSETSIDGLERYAVEIKSMASETSMPVPVIYRNVKAYIQSQLPFHVAEERVSALTELVIERGANVLELLVHEQSKITGKIEFDLDKGVNPLVIDQVAEHMKSRAGVISIDSAKVACKKLFQ